MEPNGSPKDDETYAGPFACSVARPDNALVFALDGELDLASAEHWERTVREAVDTSTERVVIDLERLTFIDSSGLRALMRLQARLDARIRLQILPGPPAVQRVFTLAGVDAALPFVSREG